MYEWKKEWLDMFDWNEIFSFRNLSASSTWLSSSFPCFQNKLTLEFVRMEVLILNAKTFYLLHLDENSQMYGINFIYGEKKNRNISCCSFYFCSLNILLNLHVHNPLQTYMRTYKLKLTSSVHCDESYIQSNAKI